MATTQYIGARYVPRHLGEWDINTQYGALDVVLYTDGNSYTAKCYPPKGTPPTNDQYWSLSANFNQQLASLTEKVEKIEFDYPPVSVKEYGAKGDGVTDDTTAIQNAVNENRCIYFPKGNYIITSTIDVKTKTTVKGESRNNTIISKTSNGSDPYGINAVFNILKDNAANTCDNVFISDITIDGDEKTDYGIYYGYGTGETGCDSLYIKKCTYGIYLNVGCWQSFFTNILAQLCTWGYYFKSAGTSTFINTFYCYDCENGFYISGLSYSSLSNLAVDNASEIAYNFAFCNLSIDGMGCEGEPNTIVKAGNCTSGVFIKNVFFEGSSKERNIFEINNTYMEISGGIIEQTDGESGATIAKLNTYANISFLECDIKKFKTLYSTNEVNNNTFTIKQKGDGIGVANNSPYIGAPFAVRNPVSTDQCYLSGGLVFDGINGNVLNTTTGNRAYSARLNRGAFVADITARDTCVSQCLVLGDAVKDEYFASTISNKSGNTITLNNLNGENGWPIPFDAKAIISNGTASATITDFDKSAKTLTLSDTSGFNVGDKIFVSKYSDFANCTYVRVPAIIFGTTANRPTKPVTAACYFDMSKLKPVWWTGSKWVDATGTDA